MRGGLSAEIQSAQQLEPWTGDPTIALLVREKERDFVNKEKGLPKKSSLAAMLTLAEKSVGRGSF